MPTRPARRSLLFRLDVALLWSSGLVSWVGIYTMFVALPIMVYERTSSPLATALTVLGGAVPPVLIGQVAGVVGDRYDRRRVMILTSTLMSVLTLGYLAVAEGPWWWLALLNLIISSVGQFIGPAEHALLPELVEEARLGEAASLNALNNNLARLIGPALGGVLFAQAGWSAAVLLNSGTYLLAAALVSGVTRNRPHAIPPAATATRSLRLEWLEGVANAWRTPHLRSLLFLLALVMFGEGFVSALLAPLVTELIGTAQTLGWILSAQAVGGIVGALWATKVADRHNPVRLLGWAALSAGLLLVITFNYALFYPQAWPAVLLTGLAGVPFAVFAAAQLQALQLLTSPGLRGRTFALAWGLNGLTQLVGITLAGLAAERWGVLVINVDAAGYLLAGIVALLITQSRSGTPASKHPRASDPDIR
ncbi:MAG: MFS transporter [bacterium]|nr:MFS transporter [bacterium]